MANSNTYYSAIGNDGAQVTTLSNIQGAGLSLPPNSEQFINLRAPGKLETLFNVNNNNEVLYSKNKPTDLYTKGLINNELSPPFYANPNQGQRQKINVSRALPIQSALRDGTRIRRFLGSGKGGAFLTKQILLQGFAPFDETKIYNPASPLLAAVRLSTFGAIERPTRFIDSSNIVGGLMGAAGLGGITKAIGGLFESVTEATPSPPRSSVASAASEPKSGLGGFFNFTGLLGGGDKADQVMPITGRDGVKGLLRGGTATNAYKSKRYSSLMSAGSGKGGFFSNLLKAAGSFLKNNTILGGLLPPTQPIAGLNYRADENTYDLMLNTNRWSNEITHDRSSGGKSTNLNVGVNQGNNLLYTGTQPTTKGGFIGGLLKGIGLQKITDGNSSGTSGMRFFATPLPNIVSKRLRLYVQTNKNKRNNSFLSVTYSTTPGVGKLTDSYTISNVEISSVDGANTNRYGDLVKIDNLSKSFDDNFFTESSKNSVMAVDNVSFEIKEGESFGLVGESGSGKSTIAKMIVNLFKPSYGDIYFDNVCITKIKNKSEMMKFRKQIQMIFQDPYSSLNGRLKVKDIISEPIKLHNPSITSSDLNDYIYDLLESVELSQKSADRYPHEFSGGQRQRISIARALATQPRLLVCDEPTSALDVSIQAQILNLLKDLQEQLNLTILFISHDLPVVRQMCDRIGVLKDGQLCEVANTEDIFLKPQHGYTKKLLYLMPKIESIYN